MQEELITQAQQVGDHWSDAHTDVVVGQSKAGRMRRQIIGLDSLLDFLRHDEEKAYDGMEDEAEQMHPMDREKLWCAVKAMAEQLVDDVDSWNLTQGETA